MRAARVGLVPLQALIAAAALAQTPGVVANLEQRILGHYFDAQGAGQQVFLGYALERFDGVAWTELLRANGQRAIAQGGAFSCWRVPDRSRALSYRLRPQAYAAQGNTLAVPIDCTVPSYDFAAPLCPNVAANPVPGGACLPEATFDVVDPDGAPGRAPPLAPRLP